MKKTLFLIAALVVFAEVSAAPPAWWSAPATQVVQTGSTASNYAPANLGQLKHFAAQAKKHLDLTLASVGGAGPEINAIVGSFEPRQGQGYTQAQIDAFKQQNYAPINLGQLKAVAKPFYQRLVALGYPAKSSLLARGGYDPSWTAPYPWNPDTDKAENYALANLGQLKMVFSFAIVDTDGDTIPDVLDPDYDSDGDGDSNGLETLTGTDPDKTPDSSDNDKDGLPNNMDPHPDVKDNPAVQLSAWGFVTPS
jgi:hypothetical protein